MDDTTTTARSKELTVGKKICVVISAIYAPYSFVLLTFEWSWDLVRLWPIFPGFAINAIHHFILDNIVGLSLKASDSFPRAILVTVMFLSVAVFIALKAGQYFWVIGIGLTLIASLFVFIFRQMLMV